MGEGGPIFEIPLDLVRAGTMKVNVFLPLALTAKLRQKVDHAEEAGEVVFTSSMSGLFSPANWGVYASTKHALESVAEAMQQELPRMASRSKPSIPAPFTPAQ